ncbi:MAG: hypothetical protein H6R15_215 [Proteobacteria bacterium]|nr:hypothetical protein [Pseudomonadota bacterium]
MNEENPHPPGVSHGPLAPACSHWKPLLPPLIPVDQSGPAVAGNPATAADLPATERMDRPVV